MELESIVKLYAVGAAAVTGGIGLTVQYIRGRWPFASLKDYGFYIRETLFENIAEPLEGKGTKFHFAPFRRFVGDEETGEQLVVSKKPQETEIDDFSFVTGGEYQGLLTLEFRWKVNSKEGANNFYYGANNDPDQVDNFVIRTVSSRLGRSNPVELRTNLEEISNEIYGYLNGEISGKEFFPEEEEDEAKNKEISGRGPLYEKTGAEIDSVSLSQLRWGDRSLEILQKVENAEAERKEALIRAEALEAPFVKIESIVDGLLKKSGLQRGSQEYNQMRLELVRDIYHTERGVEMAQSGGVIVFPLGQSSQGIMPLPINSRRLPPPSSSTPSTPSSSQEPEPSSSEDPAEFLIKSINEEDQ